MRSSRILFLIATLNPECGGPIEALRQLVDYYQTNGVAAEILCLDAPDAIWLRDYRVPVVALGPSYGVYALNFKLLPWLRRNRGRYDFFVVRGLWQFIGLAVRLALAGTSTPYFVFPHGMLDPWFKHRYPLKHLKKCFYWLLVEYWVLRNARAVIFTSEEERAAAGDTFRPYRCRQAVVSYGTAPAPADADFYRSLFYSQFPHLRSKRILLFLSRIHEKKGCDLLLRAYAEAVGADSDAHLLIAGPGSGDYMAQLRRLAEELGLEQAVTWMGMARGDMKWAAFHAAEIFILPSHQENFGVAVAESLACSTPVLISDKVNIWREVTSAGAGLVDSDSVAGARRLLGSWLALSEAEYAAMARNASACFGKYFHIQAAATHLLAILLAPPVPASKRRY